jgi:predicted transposase YdaD
MRHVGVREFRDKATTWLKGSQPLAVERHGKVVGFYIPVEEPRPQGEQFRDALLKLEQTVEEVLEKTGMSEDELAEAFDLNEESRRSDISDGNR